MWSYLLDELHNTSQKLEDPKISLNVCGILYVSLFDFVKGSRDLLNNFEKQAKEKLPYVDHKKSRSTRRMRHTGKDEDDGLENLEPRDKFRIKSCIPMIGALESDLARRASVFNDAVKKFHS